MMVKALTRSNLINNNVTDRMSKTFENEEVDKEEIEEKLLLKSNQNI